MTRRLRLIVTERVQFVGLVQKSLDRRAGNNLIGRRQQHRLTDLMIPSTHAHGKTLVAVEAAGAEDEGALRRKIGGARVQHRLHDHLHRDPCGPVGACHAAAAGAFFEARIDLRRAVWSQVQCHATGSRSMLPTTGRGRTRRYGTVRAKSKSLSATKTTSKSRLIALSRAGSFCSRSRGSVPGLNLRCATIWAPNFCTECSNAAVIAASSGEGPCNSSKLVHLRDTTYCTRASMS